MQPHDLNNGQKVCYSDHRLHDRWPEKRTFNSFLLLTEWFHSLNVRYSDPHCIQMLMDLGRLLFGSAR